MNIKTIEMLAKRIEEKTNDEAIRIDAYNIRSEIYSEDVEKINITIDKTMAKEIYDFIRTHLEVENDTPYVEQLMVDVEDLIETIE